MLLSADFMRLFLVLTILGMAALAAFHLRRRQLTLDEYLLWGLAAILIPLLGPYLVIALTPDRTAPADSAEI
jgi:hypothetical protein